MCLVYPGTSLPGPMHSNPGVENSYGSSWNPETGTPLPRGKVHTVAERAKASGGWGVGGEDAEGNTVQSHVQNPQCKNPMRERMLLW